MACLSLQHKVVYREQHISRLIIILQFSDLQINFFTHPSFLPFINNESARNLNTYTIIKGARVAQLVMDGFFQKSNSVFIGLCARLALQVDFFYLSIFFSILDFFLTILQNPLPKHGKNTKQTKKMTKIGEGNGKIINPKPKSINLSITKGE